MRIALVVISKNEDPYIEEWINYHIKLGVSNVVIYQNNWIYKGSNPNVDLIEFNGKTKQISAYRHFMNNYHDKFDWAVFIDVDEFIVLKKHKTLEEFILSCGDTNVISMNWVLFGDNGHKELGEDTSVLRRFTKRQNKSNPHIKSISRVNTSILFTNPHSTNQIWIDTNGKRGSGPYNIDGPIDVIQLNHYFTKTKPEFKNKISRGRADTIRQRSISDFDVHNFNEIEDLLAYNFLYEN
jgi:hypothetical protein